MDDSTITRAQLIDAIYHEIGKPRHDCADLFEAVLDHICAALQQGQVVKISSFGTFSVRSKTERIGRNPKTGIEAPISSRRVVVFRPSQVLRNRVNEGAR